VTVSPWRFADRLRELREAAGLSQNALARRSGLSRQALSRLELGRNEPAWVSVQLLAQALGLDCRAFADPGLRLPAAPTTRPRIGRPRKSSAQGQQQAPQRTPRRERT
jgi:transcriptional regulator with XRE-family HTH domain